MKKLSQLEFMHLEEIKKRLVVIEDSLINDSLSDAVCDTLSEPGDERDAELEEARKVTEKARDEASSARIEITRLIEHFKGI